MRTFPRAALCSLIALLTLAGCKSKQAEPPPSPIELLNSDLADLRAHEHAGFTIYDLRSNGQYSQIFGGTRTADVVKYIDARLHYYVDPDDASLGVTPSSIFSQNWLRESKPRPPTDSKVGASNLGMELWIAGLTANAAVAVEFGGQSIPVDSGRVGVMLIGEGYTSTETTRSGRTVTLPPEFRQSILIHEARHSDCTGGISAAVIEALKGETSIEDAAAHVFANMHCGHLHVFCPDSHEYHGLAACDNEAWGAYTVGEIYYRGVREDPDITSYNRSIADAMIVDYQSRSLVPRIGVADMSSAGIR